MNTYGHTSNGGAIKAPEGWRILRENEPVPRVHMEATESGHWCALRVGHSAMTPKVARVNWRFVAYAVPR